MKRIIFIIIITPLFTLSQNKKPEKLKIYLECWCDKNYLQKEMTYVDFYREPQSANLHIITKGESSSSGGRVITFRFIGRETFQGIDNNLTLDIPPNTSQDSKRKLYLETLNKGIYAYLIKTKDSDKASITYSKELQLEKEEEKDKWNSWVFRSSINGSINGEEGYTSKYYNGRISANRITEESKFLSNFSFSTSISEFNYDDFSLVTENKSQYSNITYVKSKGENFSIGARANYMKSTSYNYDGHYKLSPCIEYNIFPYSESSEHIFTILYGLSANYNDYTDTTVYLKTTESYGSQLLELQYNNRQTWGSLSFSINSNHILDFENINKYNINIYTNIDWNITKGLSLDLWSSMNFDRAQIHLPLNGATYEEIILRQKELESNYNYYVSMGISYTFGSMKNNVVNPRF